MTAWDVIAARIGTVTGEPFQIRHQRPIGGGCINTACLIGDGRRGFFVKLNAAERLAMFEAEAEGLDALAATGAMRVPAPVCAGLAGDQSYLAMETLDLGGRLDGALAGRQLAQLHRATAQTFGWHRDNTIGATPQPNTPRADWIDFWREHRLGYQLELAAAKGYGGRLRSSGERLLGALDALIGHRPPSSLLHGDLWGGNIGATPDGQPVIFDPAVYHGDREADLAMTELFGGFDARFQSAYREAWPLDSGYAVRKILYNLYHILNHLNLFGGGYLSQAQGMIDRLLAETG
ncbi:fructosamine kinase family protein [Thiocystis violascens]|uniref:Fructosamine-3-kinase n=1 Tax=Thiocystis violascens (strain ATCC 17096 / DSM 198 / 6111) TaxID=765911 RepID=I3YF72_THIV6|nr:fructosamine kinase family protein [Thiocystis violascens]AFL75640.1 fructosamine-3-kinase [Thiocystis violascens DSM 198]